MNQFSISEASQVYLETDNDGSAVYVIAIHQDGWTMRIDAPTEVDGDWLTMAQRKQWAKNKVKKAMELMKPQGGEV